MEEASQDKIREKAKTDQPIDQSIIEQGHVLNDWFVFRNERHFGPMSTKQVRYLLSKKLIANTHHIWRPGFTGWTPMCEVESFRSYGKSSVDFMNDDDFSSRALLSGIDRITAERNQIDFIDKTKSNAYSLEQIRLSRASRGLSPQAELIEKVDNLFGVFGERFRSGKIVLAGLAVLFLIGGILSANSTKPNVLLSEMSSAVKERMITVSNKAESITNPSMEIFKQKNNSGDPVLITATNLPIGARLQFEIVGEPSTLLGAYRFDQKIELNVESKIFKTPSIRQDSGKFLPPGKYNVLATCLSCGAEKKTIYSKQFTFGITNSGEYEKSLAKFHEETRQNAKLELIELGDLSENLNQQFSNTTKRFSRAVSNQKIVSWERFSATWLMNQRKLIDLFDQMNSKSFKADLYYLGLYEAYNNIIAKIFELHILQDGILKGNSVRKNQILEESKMASQIKLELVSLKSQLDLMNVNFNRTNGLPEKTGLNL